MQTVIAEVQHKLVEDCLSSVCHNRSPKLQRQSRYHTVENARTASRKRGDRGGGLTWEDRVIALLQRPLTARSFSKTLCRHAPDTRESCCPRPMGGTRCLSPPAASEGCVLFEDHVLICYWYLEIVSAGLLRNTAWSVFASGLSEPAGIRRLMLICPWCMEKVLDKPAAFLHRR